MLQLLQALFGAGFCPEELGVAVPGGFSHPCSAQGLILPGHGWSTAPKISPSAQRACTEGLGVCCSPNTNALKPCQTFQESVLRWNQVQLYVDGPKSSCH